MHLLIDGQALQTSSSRQRGIGRYSSNLLRALAAARPSWRIEVVQNGVLTPIAADDLNGLPVLSFQPPLRLTIENHEINDCYYADWLTARCADGVLVLSHCEGWDAVVPIFRGRRPRVFGITYDLIPLLYPEHYLTNFGTLHWYAHRFRHMLRSDALLAISEATARDVRALGGASSPLVVNIGGAVDPLFTTLSPSELPARAQQVRERFGLHREFLLYVGTPEYRKNLRGAILAFGALEPACQNAFDLAVVCRMKPSERSSIEETARRAGVASALRLICSADDEDLRALYQMCRLFFFPSLYEGLGLPVLEALQCGAPVVTSNCSSLPEYAGTISWMGDPGSPRDMARVLQQALTEPREARRDEREAFARTFSWRKTADRACAVMERITMRKSNAARRRRRLAWVMPLAKEAGSHIEYAQKLLPRLAERYDIDLIAASKHYEATKGLARHHIILTAAEVVARHLALPYDMFIYLISGPPSSPDMLTLLHQYPGLIVLHNFDAADLNWFSENQLLPRLHAADSIVGEKKMAGEFAQVLGVLVHSAELWQQVRRALNAPVVHLSMPSALSPTRNIEHDQIGAYSAWIDLAIARHERSDGPWRGFAVRRLAACGPQADSIVNSWAVLRATGQQEFAARSQDSESAQSLAAVS
ncbi:MAG: glycosyltransferase family 4 protein [Gemmataceae bacterium]